MRRTVVWVFTGLLGGLGLVGLSCSKSGGNSSPATDADNGGQGGGSAGAGGSGGKAGSAGSGGGGSGGTKGNASLDAPSDLSAAPDASSACKGVPAIGLKLFLDGNATRISSSSFLFLAQPPADPRIYIVERAGIIRIFRNGALEKTPFLDMRPSVSPPDGERGLLSVAFHPQYAQNGRFFVYYTRRSSDPYSTGAGGDVVISEGKRSTASPDVADAALKALVTADHSTYSNHNGGTVAFGPDGYLYAGTGDGGKGGDPFKNGQKLDAQLGKILRIDVDNPTARPPGNIDTAGSDPHIWDYGLRNPFRFSFDRATGDLYIGDVGQDIWEEIDFEPKGQGKNNYGWSVMEATHCYGGNTCDMASKILPVAEYEHLGAGNAKGRSVTGGYVYRGKAIPCLAGRYIYGEYVKNQVFSFVMSGGKATDAVELTGMLVSAQTPLRGLASFSEDADGELYLFSLSDNRIYKIAPR